jgi:4-amino-4-deoxy-L-arabinose transferase-like glycosyltransferase
MPPDTREEDERSSASPAVLSAQEPRAKHILLLIIIGILVLGPALGSSVVWLNAEKRVWEVTQTMLHTKSFMVPYLGGEPHLTKPPLVYWMGAVTGLLSHRDDAFVIRVPSVLCAIICMVFTYLLGCNLESRRVGFLAALILVSSYLFTERGVLGTFDIPLTAAVVLALYGAWQWVSSRKKAGVILLLLGSVLGFMIKGPVAWIIVTIAVIGQLAMRRELKRLATWHILAFIGVLLVCSSVWFVYVIVREPLAKTVFVNELSLVVGKVPHSPTAKHYKPFYQYLVELPRNVAPWSIYLPLIALLFFRRRLLTRASPLSFPIIWVVGNIVFFSLIPSKQGAYLLPLYPAIAIIVSWSLVASLQGERRETSWLRNTHIALGILCLPTGIGFAVVFWARVGAPLALCIGVGSLFAATGVAVIRASWSGKNKPALVYFLVGWFLFIPLLYGYFMPRHRYISEYKASPEAKAYMKRSEGLRNFFGI